MDKEEEVEFQKKLKQIIDGVMLAHKRGAFSMEESSELWKTIKFFIEEKNT
jgi:hypothetical protein